ncbi:hypothetical protein GRI75_06940 [Altererythrobacter soli]|uniref:ATP-grasp domain-containing protein n=2 Tax=Croceibacterium soli TaxID=1739690 RepID=A0A6I4USE4_9SPHN|nr:hypothetical protein [Croceibacterium soli]
MAAVAPANERLDTSIPIILLGGRENTVAMVRNFGRLGVRVYVSGSRGCRAMRSRYCRGSFAVPGGTSAREYWRDLLTVRLRHSLAGAVVIANCDESMAFLASHDAELRPFYRLEEFSPALRLAMLDKFETLKLAQAAGLPTPRFWRMDRELEVADIQDELSFPLMVKPLDTARFSAQFGRKLFIVESGIGEVEDKVALCRAHGHAVMLVEMIPGPDKVLSSYYTYRTDTGRFLYDYTKTVVRRWPVNRGGATLHRTKQCPETARLGRQLFQRIGWAGIANVEFKRDARDGKLKIIEVNGRFTAAHRLVTESGAPIDLAVYCHLTGQRLPAFSTNYRRLRLWYPLQDLLALRDLRRRGELSLREWLRSITRERILLPYFSMRDPLPGLEDFAALLGRAVVRLLRPRSHVVEQPTKAGNP